MIDDDLDVLDVLEEILRYADFNVRKTQDGENILSVIGQFKPDLVLMDYSLAGVNGGEVCRQIKTNGQTSSLPVILISAYPRARNSFGYYGCDAFIAKPFDMTDLITQINGCFQPV